MPDTLLGAGTCISKLRNFCKFKPYLITAKKSRGGGIVFNDDDGLCIFYQIKDKLSLSLINSPVN